jgi:EAL domain-containing protein (putative c-di-GMP-specific phosphodiesterase class I)
VSETLQEVVRGTDVLSRIGGDEFTLIVPNADKKGIENLASKINESLMALEFLVDDQAYEISSSIGIAIYPQHGSNEYELLSNADLAMYKAKESGRGQYHIFSTDIDYHSQLTSRLYWKEIIEDALENERFILLFQPILDMKTNQITHYECLSRIKTEDGSFLMPSDFIGLADELGLIGQIDRVLLKQAIKQHKRFKQQGNNIKLAINLSSRSFNNTAVFEDIKALLDVPEVDPGQFVFEITEAAAVSDFSAAQDLIKKIKGLGCSLALDDFGMGFSSFFYLKHLAVDYVKIDGSFIKQLDMSFEDKVFVRAMIEVSQALGKKTVAEFVENEEILMFLKGFGVDYVQGYHIGKPDFIE